MAFQCSYRCFQWPKIHRKVYKTNWSNFHLSKLNNCFQTVNRHNLPVFAWIFPWICRVPYTHEPMYKKCIHNQTIQQLHTKILHQNFLRYLQRNIKCWLTARMLQLIDLLRKITKWILTWLTWNRLKISYESEKINFQLNILKNLIWIQLEFLVSSSYVDPYRRLEWMKMVEYERLKHVFFSHGTIESFGQHESDKIHQMLRFSKDYSM